MFKVIALGLAIGASLQAWRQYPPDGTPRRDAAMVVFIVGLAVAFAAGRWWGHTRPVSARATATATATANAAAVGNSVNVAVIVPGQGAKAHGVAVPGDGPLPWMVEGGPASVGELDGLDLDEVASILELDRVTDEDG